MMHFISILRAYGLGLMGACWFLASSPAWAAQTPPPAQNGQSFDYHKPWAWGLDGEKVWLGYYGQDHGFYLKPQGSPEQRLNPPGGAVSSGLVFEAVGPEVYALWRDKDTRKRLLFARSADGGKTYAAPVPLDQDSDPLTRLKMKVLGPEVYLLWLGEKNKRYDLYFKYSGDHGRTFIETQPVLPGIYPAWIVDEKGVYVFSRASLEGKDYFALRRFDPRTRTFDETFKIKEAPPIPPFFEAFRSGDRLFLAWVGQYGDLLNELRLEGAYSDDKGRSWKDFTIAKGPAGIDFTKIEFCYGGGHVYAAYSASRRFAVSSSKESVYLARSADNGATWSESQELRHEAMPNTRANSPSLVCDDRGKVVMAWEDWRLIRPRIFLNYSKDFGTTWSPRDYPLEPVSSRDNLGLDPLVPGLKAFEPKAAQGKEGQGGRYYLMGQRYKNDGLADRDLVLYTLSPDFFQKAPAPLRAPGSEDLKSRVDGYWKAMEKGDYTAAYDFIDPFYHARHLREEYIAKSRPMQYHNHEIKDVKVEGNVAQVTTAIEYSVPKLNVGTKEFSREKTPASFTDTWIYVDNQWYQSYQEAESGYRYAQY